MARQQIFSDFDDSTRLGRELIAKLHEKYVPACEKYGESEQAALALYFLPHGSKKAVLEPTRPRVVKWYCPFADQRIFPSGHRYCINVYTGCEYGCVYCYANGYLAETKPKAKEHFRRDLLRDLDDLDRFDVPSAPVHLSNSTEALQPIETVRRDTLFTLQNLSERRHRFTSVTFLTKNPAMLLEDDYLKTLQKLNRLKSDHPKCDFFCQSDTPPLRVECSLAFYREEARKLFDSRAPSVAKRMEAIRELCREGIPVTVRIDPLFPRNPLPGGLMMKDFDFFDFQSETDLNTLVDFCAEAGVRRMVYSVAKITKPRFGALPESMQKLRRIYEHLAGTPRLEFRGGSWRLPFSIGEEFIVRPLRFRCEEKELPLFACKENLLGTP